MRKRGKKSFGNGEQMQPKPKMKAAARTLQHHYLAERLQLRRAGNYEILRCLVKLDRIVITAIAISLQALCAIPGYRAGKTKLLWRQLYGEVTRILGTGSIHEIIVESAPNARWLPRFRITIVPRDPTGLLFQDLRFILELIPNFKLVLVEIAFDFPLETVVDTLFVRRHMLAGKTRLRPGGNALHERWGSARSSKVVRAYAKFEASSFRIEFQLNARFLRQHGIDHVSDFAKLATILPRHHIHFAALDNNKLRQHLRRSALPHKTKTEILRAVATNRKSLWSTLRLLRRKWHFVNARRLLTPVTEMNALVVAALNERATQWQTHSPLRAVDKTNEQLSQ
jgi:hypothetical protein